ncbi:hypothetical protein DAPPUDRAFT_253509 [Daphnia pulex]|uniref:Homeobox domain-containing protein n=1 Tax=Daphnia pulex TaxID=6669 RepID=E9H4Z2_DAPPU|nr:hypothetical protein DAPPUDRAFT_253496 [Daphnia pulex]EFX73242.1 hypothetical protein DAPPUDRAFT_253509 [Daphnia pulex]|eukprot:EFX73232.1 hypothetical protein DAPPUDRAFT_253496 [Daphnia pulex]
MASYDYYPVDSTAKSSRSGRQRHFYDEVQLELLDAEFARNSFPNREGRRRIAQLIGVSEKSIMWWFQNRRRRARQLGSSRAATSTHETNRQHRRSSPYVSQHQRRQDSSVSPQVLPTPAGFFFDPTVGPSLEPINYSTSESTPPQSPTESPPQSEWVAANFQKEVLSPPQFNCNYSTTTDGSHPEQQPQQQQDYSSCYWNNWEYSPFSFCASSSVQDPAFYSSCVPTPYDFSPTCSYSPETTNQFYYHSYM